MRLLHEAGSMRLLHEAGSMRVINGAGSLSTSLSSSWRGRVSGIRRGRAMRGRRLRARSASRSSCLFSAASRSSWRRRIASASACWRRSVSRENSRAAYSPSLRSGLTKSGMGSSRGTSRAELVRLWRMSGRRTRPGDAIVGCGIAESRALREE